MRFSLGAVLIPLVLAGCGGDGESAVNADAPRQGGLSLFERPYSSAVDGPKKGSFLPAVRIVDIRYARTVGDIDYFIAKGRGLDRGPELCLLEKMGGHPQGATCNPSDRIINDVIWLANVGDTDMIVSGVASDAVAELSAGSVTDEPENNVFVLPDVPLDETELEIRFADGRETTTEI